jgi:hypothetical protein
MDVQTLASTIQSILAPVVMITACAITLGGLWSHALGINDRLRALNHERLELWRVPSSEAYTAERLLEIDTQTPILVRRHRRLLDAIVAMYAAILVYIFSMFAIAGAAFLNMSATLALLLFLAGTLLLLVAILLAILEIRSAQTAVEFEVKRVASLPFK